MGEKFAKIFDECVPPITLKPGTPGIVETRNGRWNYIIRFYESKAIVEVKRRICKSNEQETFKVGTYLAEKNEWQYNTRCILRPTIESEVEKHYVKSNALS